jgi:hypothetical protein
MTNDNDKIMKVIFLDIDGVLLPFGGDSSDGNSNHDDHKLFPRQCVDALRRILDHAVGAKLVLSSTWRMRPDFIQDILNCLNEYDVHISQFYDTTSLAIHSLRQWEIADWILTRNNIKKSEVEKREQPRQLRTPQICWLALDDEDLLEDPKYKEMFVGHVIKTESSVGLTMDDADEAIRLWNTQMNNNF